MNSRSRNFAVVSRKIILQLLALNRICRPLLSRKLGLQPFQTEAAVFWTCYLTFECMSYCFFKMQSPRKYLGKCPYPQIEKIAN